MDDFNQDALIGDAANSGQQTVIVNDSTVDRHFIVNNVCNISITDENTENVRTLESFFSEKIDKETDKIVEMVENRIQNETLTSMDEIITLKIELEVWSINASSGQNVASVTANSKRWERKGINVPSLNAFLKETTQFMN